MRQSFQRGFSGAAKRAPRRGALFAVVLRDRRGSFVKRRVEGIEVLFVEFILCDAQAFAEALVVDDLALAEELDGLANVGVVDQAQDVVVGRACLLLCCTFISANFFIGKEFLYHMISFCL